MSSWTHLLFLIIIVIIIRGRRGDHRWRLWW